MAQLEGDNPLADVQDKAQQAAAVETAPAPVRRRRSMAFQLAMLLLISAFAILTLLVTTTSTQGVDLLVTRSLQGVSSPFFGSLMDLISWFGYTPQSFVIVAAIILLLYGFGLHWEALAALIAAVIAEAFSLLVKDAVRRARPAADQVRVFISLGSYSFPSGHVTFYMGFFGFIWFLAFSLLKPSWKRTLLLVIFGIPILLIGVSRVYLGEHWASDVLGGYLLGSLALIASIQLYRWGKGRVFERQPVAPEKEA